MDDTPRSTTTARKRVLITGANGNLGRRLVTRLTTDHDVRAVVRSERARAQLLEATADLVETVVLDYGDREALTRASNDCTHAVHLVGIIKESARSTYEDAHEITTQALALAADANALERIVYLSILGADVASANPCLASKARAEAYLLAAKTPATILRVPMVLGEGDFASRALAQRARSRTSFTLRSASREQPIYAGDVIEAVIASLARTQRDDAIFDLAGPESLSRAELIRRAGRLQGFDPRVVSIPLALGMAAAFVLERISGNPPITRAMLGVLDHDDDIESSETAMRLGIALTSLDETLRRTVSIRG